MPPVPVPHLFFGTIISGTRTDVLIDNKPAAVAGTVHIPQGGTFVKPPMNQGRVIIGSTTVLINNKPAARMGDVGMTCNDPVDLPTGKVMFTAPTMILIGG